MQILFSRNGCAQCEDIALRSLLNDEIQRLSLDDAEGLSLAAFYMMFVKEVLVTPSLYVGEDRLCGDGGKKFYGQEVVDYLTLQNGGRTMICFYHNDLDGHCSGAIIKQFHPACRMIEIAYGDSFPWELFKSEDKKKVFMVDFCLQPFEDMEKLNSLCDLTWIDHHKSAILTAKERNFSPGAQLTEIGKAGCELTWEFFHTFENIPKAVKLLGRYDVWDHTDPNTLPFQYGIKRYDTNPCNQEGWNEWFSGNIDHIVRKGRIIQEFVAKGNKLLVEKYAFEIELGGLKCIAVNQLFGNSQIFESIWNPEKHDAMLVFGFTGNQYTISLYSTKEDIDVSVVAKEMGGGGHKGAAGFQCNEFPFKDRGGAL